MAMFDIAYNSEQPLMVSTVDTVMIMVKEVAHFQPVGSRCVPVGCSSSLKDPVQHLPPVGVALKSVWLYITLVCIFDSADAFYMIAPTCSVESIKATIIMVMVVCSGLYETISNILQAIVSATLSLHSFLA